MLHPCRSQWLHCEPHKSRIFYAYASEGLQLACLTPSTCLLFYLPVAGNAIGLTGLQAIVDAIKYQNTVLKVLDLSGAWKPGQQTQHLTDEWLAVSYQDNSWSAIWIARMSVWQLASIWPRIPASQNLGTSRVKLGAAVMVIAWINTGPRITTLFGSSSMPNSCLILWSISAWATTTKDHDLWICLSAGRLSCSSQLWRVATAKRRRGDHAVFSFPFQINLPLVFPNFFDLINQKLTNKPWHVLLS